MVKRGRREYWNHKMPRALVAMKPASSFFSFGMKRKKSANTIWKLSHFTGYSAQVQIAKIVHLKNCTFNIRLNSNSFETVNVSCENNNKSKPALCTTWRCGFYRIQQKYFNYAKIMFNKAHTVFALMVVQTVGHRFKMVRSKVYHVYLVFSKQSKSLRQHNKGPGAIRILFYDTEKRYIYILNLTRLVISIHTVFKAILTVLIHQINVYFKNTTSI